MKEDVWLEQAESDSRDRIRFERLNYRLRMLILLAAGFLIGSGLIATWIIFSYIFNLATHPLQFRDLLDQWAVALQEETNSPIPFLPSESSPNRWLALAVLGLLAYLLTRIPLLLLQMGTQLMSACTDERRLLQTTLREMMRQRQRPPQSNESKPL